MTEGVADRPAPRGRAVLWFFIAVLLVALAASVYYSMTVGAKPARLKLALITWNEDPFWIPVIRGARDAADLAGADLTVIQSKPDMESQNAHIRDLLSQHIDGLAISPNNPMAQLAVLDEAGAKTVLVTFDSDAPASKRRLFVGIDNYAAGALAAEELRNALPEGGAVLISVGSIDMPNASERRQGLIDSLLERPFKLERPLTQTDPADAVLKGSKYTIAATVLDNGDPAKASAMVADALRTHPEVKAVVGLFSYSAPAALPGIEKAGRAGQVKVIGFDDTDATQAALEAGTMQASILQDAYMCGNETIRVLADEVRGRTRTDAAPRGERRILVATEPIHKEDLATLRDKNRVRVPATTMP